MKIVFYHKTIKTCKTMSMLIIKTKRLHNCVAAGKQPVGLLPTTQEIGFEGFVSFVTKKR